ncbi:Ig-like domain-containing protein [Lacunimicrobium album]
MSYGIKSFNGTLDAVDTADIAKFTLTTPGTLFIDVTSDQNLKLEIYQDINGDLAAQQVELLASLSVAATTECVKLSEMLSSGVYYLRITSENTSLTTTYTTKLSAGGWGTNDAGNDLANATALVPGGAFRHDVIQWNDIDVYKFTLNTASNAHLRFNGFTQALSYQIIKDTNNNQRIDTAEILEAVTSDALDPIHYTGAFSAGTYFVSLTSQPDIKTAYSVYLSITELKNATDGGNSNANASELIVNNPAIQDQVQTGDEDYYRFEITQPTYVNFQIEGVTERVIVTLKSSNGTIVVSSQVNDQFYSTKLLAADTYYVHIKNQSLQSSQDNSAYTVRVRTINSSLAITNEEGKLLDENALIEFGTVNSYYVVKKFLLHNTSSGTLTIQSTSFDGTKFTFSPTMPLVSGQQIATGSYVAFELVMLIDQGYKNTTFTVQTTGGLHSTSLELSGNVLSNTTGSVATPFDLAYYLQSAQLENGAIRMINAPGAYSEDGRPIYVIDSYFASIALWGLLEGPEIAGIDRLDMARRFIQWYADHLNTDGSIERYWYFDDSSVGGPTTFSDGQDSAASMFLLLVGKYAELSSDTTFLLSIQNEVRLASNRLLTLQQPNGLTHGATYFPVMYLADAAESYAGFRGAAIVESLIYQDSERAEIMNAAADLTRQGIVNDLYDESTGLFYISLQKAPDDATQSETGPELIETPTGKYYAQKADFSNWYNNQGISFLIVWPTLFGVIDPGSEMAQSQAEAMNEHWGETIGNKTAWWDRTDTAGVGIAQWMTGDFERTSQHLNKVARTPILNGAPYPSDAVATIADIGFVLKLSGPIAVKESATTNLGDTIIIDALANDYSLLQPGQPLSITSVSAAHGTAVITTDGKIQYTSSDPSFGQDEVTYTVSDGTYTRTSKIQVTVNRSPSNVSLSSLSISENLPPDTPVGSLTTTTDPDAGNTHTYSLVAGTGSTDNAAFTIVGNQLLANASFDYETKSSYTIRVRTTDQSGLFFEKTFTISVTDVFELPPGATLLTNLRYGVGGTDNATGVGYMMYSQQNVRTRFSGLDSNNANNFINVRYDGGQWQYDNNLTWVNFTPTSTDVLVASIDFTTDTVTMLKGNFGIVNGISMGYLDGDLLVTANQWKGQANAGEFGVSGRFISFAASTPLNNLRFGVAAIDNATGTGYLMYSQQSLQSRFPGINSTNASNFINVRLNGAQWQYDNNSTWVNFVPTSSDRLVAELDFTADTVDLLKGTFSTIQGIASGYLDGDLSITPNNWNGNANTGEYHLTGTFITFMPTIA